MKKSLSLFLSLLLCISASAQEVITASGTYQYHAPQSMNPAQAKAEAIFQAKLHIIADNFGTVLSSTAYTRLSNDNGQSSSSATTFSESEVKGEWLETIGEPEVSQSITGNAIVTTVTIKGKIRKIEVSKIEIIAKPLSDPQNHNSECYDFSDRSNFFLLFEAPVNGYLAIYLSDGRNVFRMLPGKESHTASFNVSHNKEYCFFDDEHSDGEFSKKMRLVTSYEIEVNKVYVIFSPNQFTKAIDNIPFEDKATPVLSEERFQKWMGRCRNQDKDMIVSSFAITIKK